MRNYQKTKLKIVTQGGPVANDAYILEKGDRVASIFVDFKSKNCEIFCTGADGKTPLISIERNNDSLYLEKGSVI